MGNLFDMLLNRKQYKSPLARSRAGMIYVTLGLMVLVMTLYSALVPQWGDGTPIPLFTLIAQVGIINYVAVWIVAFYILAALTFTAVRTGRLTIGSWSLVATWLLAGVWLNLFAQPTADSASLSLAILMLFGALLLSVRGVLATFIMSIASLFTAVAIREPTFSATSNIITITIQVLSIALVLYFFLRYFRLSIVEGVSEAIEERLRGTDIIAKTADLLGQHVTQEELTNQIAQLFLDSFDYLYQARIYTADENGIELRVIGDAVRADGTTGALQSLQRDTVGGVSAIGEASNTLKPVVNRLEQGEYDVAIPMRLGKQINGVLNLRTRFSNQFEQPSILNAFQGLADAVALAMEGLRQFARAEARAQESSALNERLQHLQREIDRISQRLTSTAWSQYVRGADKLPSLSVDFLSEEINDDTEWTPTLADAASNNQLVQDVRNSRQVIAVPLRVRGQVIGAMEFELDEERAFTPEDYDLMQDVSERFGLAVENTRLVQESQTLAQREAFINQISARLQTTNNVQSALTEAARGLMEALKAAKVSIKLGEPDAELPKSSSNGNGSRM